MASKLFISPDQLRSLSFALAAQVKEHPTFLIPLWRGGTPIGCYVHEFLKRRGAQCDHIPIRTSRYQGQEGQKEVRVHGLGYIFDHAKEGDSILLVDDVWDAGTTMKAVIDRLSVLKVKISVAVIFFKPQKNLYPELKPDYYVDTTNAWLVFPHELEDLSKEEIVQNYGEGTWYLIGEK